MFFGRASPQVVVLFRMCKDVRLKKISETESAQQKLAEVRDNLTSLSATNLQNNNFLS
jgi:hypothetical protein